MAEVTTDCRTEPGITVGLVDAIISLARVLVRDGRLDDPDVMEALKDMASDEDVRVLIKLGEVAHGSRSF